MAVDFVCCCAAAGGSGHCPVVCCPAAAGGCRLSLPFPLRGTITGSSEYEEIDRSNLWRSISCAAARQQVVPGTARSCAVRRQQVGAGSACRFPCVALSQGLQNTKKSTALIYGGRFRVPLRGSRWFRALPAVSLAWHYHRVFRTRRNRPLQSMAVDFVYYPAVAGGRRHCRLEFCGAGRAREGQHVPDVGDAGQVHDHALEAHAEARVLAPSRTCAARGTTSSPRRSCPAPRCAPSSTSRRSSRWLPPHELAHAGHQQVQPRPRSCRRRSARM